MHIEIFSDGSATTDDKPGGYGWVITVDGQKHSEGSGHLPLASNNDAELRAAIEGLSNARLAFGQPPIGCEMPTFTLVSDSQLILGWANGTYAFRQIDKIDQFQALKLLAHNLNLKTRWVEGHSGDIHNERCDELANLARTGKPKNKKKKKDTISKTLIRQIISESNTAQIAIDNIVTLIDN